ncbi:MAG: translocation/assembly module TamB domain-containing protein [Spirochaetia bacterium]
MRKAFAIAGWLTLFAGLVALTTFAAVELDRALTARMQALKAGAVAELERMAGRTISYGEISPSFFQSMEIRDLVIHDSADPGRALLTVHQVRVYYSLFRLLAGQDPVEAIREIRLLNTTFAVDLQKDTDVVDLVRRLLQNGGGAGLRARVTGADIGVSIVSHGSSIDLRHLFFQVEALSQAISVSVRGGVGGRLTGGFSFDSSIKAEGTLDRSLAGSDATIHLVSFSSSLVNAGAQTLELAWKGNTIEVHKIQDRSPLALDAYADLDRRELTVHFQSQDLRPDRLITFSRPLGAYANWLRVPLTASGHVTYHAATGRLEYEADASAVLADQLPIRDVTLTTSVTGSEKEAFFHPLRLSSSSGTAEFAGSVLLDTFFPSGLLSLSDVDTGSGEKVNASLAIDRVKDRLEVNSSHLAIGEVGLDSFRLSLAPLPAGASFSLSTAFEGSPPEDLLQASGDLRFGRSLRQVVARGGPEALPAPAVSVAATLKNIPPAKLYHLLLGAGRLTLDQQGVFNLLSHYLISTEAVVSTDLAHLSLAARSVTVTSSDDPATSFRFGLSVDKSHLSLTGFSGAWKGIGIQGGFEGDLAAGGQVGFATNLTLLGTSYFFTGRYSQSGGLSANGSYGFSVAAVPIRGGGALLKLRGDKFPLPLASGPRPVTFDVSGLVTPEGEWSASFSSITIYDVPLPQSPHAVVELSGRITPQTLDITRLSVTDQGVMLAGSARADITLPGDLFDPQFLNVLSVQGSASLRSSDGVESYAVKGGMARGVLALAVQFDGVPLSRFGVDAVQGTLSASGTVTGPPAQPIADMSVSLKQGRLGTDALALEGRLLTRQDGIDVRSVSVSYLAHKVTGGEGSLNVKNGTFAFKGQFQTEVFSDAIGVGVALEGSYSNRGVPALATGIFDLGLQGKLSLSGIKVGGTDLPSWAISFRTFGGRISFDGGPGNSIHGWIDPQLSFSALLQDPIPITGSMRGRVTQDRIHADVDVESFDLLALNSILKSPSLNMGAGPTPVIRFTAGVASGRLVVDGEVNDPDFTGQLDIVGGGILTAYSPQEAGPIRTTMVFDGKGFHIPKTSAVAGTARLTATASFTIDHWIPMTWDVSLTTEASTSVRLRARFGILNAEGSGSGTLHVAGDDRKTTIDGAIVVSDCRITLGKVEVVKFVPEEPPTYANLTVETGRRVEFHWPSEALPVLQTTAIPGGKVAITYRGDTGAFTVKGSTGVQGGEIYYFDRSFIMRKGSITFNESEANFDPWITARAEVREWDPSTSSEARIYLDADGPFSKFSPRFSSDPPHTDPDIMAMIGAPIVNRAETQGVGMAAIMYTDVVGQNLVLRPFEQRVRQALNLDMFSLRTQILQNLVAERVFGTTINPLDNTSVSLGKYLGNDLFLEALVRLQQPLNPVSVLTSSGGIIPESTALQPDFELSIEWATPLFLMSWIFDPQHPETLFLSDNSLSFSWRISY